MFFQEDTPYLNKIKQDLDTISKIRAGDRLCTEGEYLKVVKESFATTAYRTFYRDSRLKTVRAIKDRTLAMMEITHLISESRYLTYYDIEHGERVDRNINRELIKKYNDRIRQLHECYDCLNSSLSGIHNLLSTYLDDTDMTGTLNSFVVKITAHIKNMGDFLRKLRESKLKNPHKESLEETVDD
jgi:hypothetical protein